MRFVPAIVSLAFGFAATSGILWWNLDDDFLSKEVFSASSSGVDIASDINQQPISFRDGGSIYLTVCSLYLWTWVAFLHTLHDLFLWYIPFCASSMAAALYGFVWIGIAVVIGGMFFSNGGTDFTVLDLITYFGVEVFVSWFVWFPLAATILFSGVVGCWRVPIIGGRPWEMRSTGESGVNFRGPVDTMSAFQHYDS